MAHQSPLIAIPRKSTTDADWAGPIRSTIAHSFGESPDNYAEEISSLMRCRQDAVRGAGSDATARDLLYKYFGQLELLELRFSEVKVSFAWNDAFTGKLTTQTSLAFEKASIIHLLAAVLSSLAATQSRADPEGLKRAYFNCRATAGMLTYINENFLHAPSTDLSRDVVHLLISLSLAQATEVFLEKLVDEKKAAGLIARTANQLATMYQSLADEMKDFIGKGVFDRHWMRLIDAKAKYFPSLAQYQKGLADDAAGKHGAALVRYKKADEDAKEALRFAQAFAYQLGGGPVPTLPNDAGTSLVEITKAHAAVVAEEKAQATKNNDLIYHDILPSEASLPAIDKLPAATPVSIQEVYSNTDVSKLIGPDIFIRLIPLAVHESASVYSEEKAKLARAEVERVELSEVEVRAALEHLGLPAAVNAWRRMADGDDADADVDVSPGLVRIAGEVQRSGPTDARVRKVEGERTRCERELQELTAALDNESRECERARAKHAPKFTQTPSGPHTAAFRQTISSNLSSLSSAASSDAQIAKLWGEIQPDVSALQGGPDALRAQARDVALGKNKPAPQVPEGMSLLDLADDEQSRPTLDSAEAEELRRAAKEASDKLDRLHKVRKERDEVLKDLKEKLQSDDVSNLLLLNRRSGNVEPQLFAAELEKFRPYQSRLSAATQASKTLTNELEGIVQRVERGRGVRERNRSAKDKSRRLKEWERRLERAGASLDEVNDGLGKAEEFYASVDAVVADLKREVHNFISTRDSERNRMVSDIETRNRLGSPSASSPSHASAPRSSAPGISSQFAGMNLGGSSSPYPPPPKPTSPASPSNANPYDFGSLSSLPRAFDTSSPPPPPKPSYPSFPSVPTSPPPTTSPSHARASTQSPYPPSSSSSAAYPFPPQRQTSYGSYQNAPYPPPPSSSSYGSNAQQAYPPPPPSRPSYPPPSGYGSSSPYPAPPQPQHSQPPHSQPQQQYGQAPSQPPQPSYPSYAPPPMSGHGYPAPPAPPRQGPYYSQSHQAPPPDLPPQQYGGYSQHPPSQQSSQHPAPQQPSYGQPPQHEQWNQWGGYKK